MRNLIDFLKNHNHWFVFILLEVICFVQVFRYNNYQSSVWFSSANAVAGKLLDISESVGQYFSLTEVNRQLTDRNIELERQLAQLAAERAKVDNDTTILERLEQKAMAGYTTIPAKVVSNSINKEDNFITIDKGSADGVRKDMGVTSGTGVVGVVYLVSTHYSVVIPVLNSHSNISCTLRGRGYFGYLHWNGGEADVAYLDDVPRHARFRHGDIVETSGYSSVFPPGIIVGTVTKVYNSANGLSYRMKLKLSTDFGNLRDVSVISDKAMEEKLQLIEAANDSLKPKN